MITNLEHYKEELINNAQKKYDAIITKEKFNLHTNCDINNFRDGYCSNNHCVNCLKENLEWLGKEYKEPKTKLTKEQWNLITPYNNAYSFTVSDWTNNFTINDEYNQTIAIIYYDRLDIDLNTTNLIGGRQYLLKDCEIE